jgi:hypothetical protein
MYTCMSYAAFIIIIVMFRLARRDGRSAVLASDAMCWQVWTSDLAGRLGSRMFARGKSLEICVVSSVDVWDVI